ncbi:MAG: dTMP kinase [Planctomycetota bacterium]|nr:MAG: dTMP kinase [Planctomycetota bacterium]
MNLKDKLTGKFIVFDGPDGSGKGTQIDLLADRLTAEGIDVVRAVDPGGTVIGDRIRSVLLDHDLSQMDVRCETFLFMASRAQLIGEVIAPALQAGKVVLCDRFISATCAYQGAGGYDIKRIIELGRFAIGETWPHLTFILNVPVEEGFKRTGRKPHHAGKHRKRHDGDQGMLFKDIQTDAMESRPVDFHRKVRDIFLNLPADYPGKVEIIDATGSPPEVHKQIVERLTRVDF